MYACYIDDIVKLLLDTGVSVNSHNDRGQTPLILAASCGNENECHLLLEVSL